MFKHLSALHLAILLVGSLSNGTSAQSKVCVEQLSAGIPCCEQYECMGDR